MATEIREIPIGQLIYDPENPRLPKSVDGRNESAVIEWMLKNENLTDLMMSIAEKGYFPAEPIWVVEIPDQEGFFEVIEGNRRLSALKLLLNPELGTSRHRTILAILDEAKVEIPLSIPAIVFPNKADVNLFLGYRHVTGVEPWDALAKAKYLKKIEQTLPKADSQGQKYRTLAKLIGSKANFVKQILTGLTVYEVIENNNYFEIPQLDEKSVQFGVLYTALDNPKIAYFVNLDEDLENPASEIDVDKLKELTSWMFEKHSEGNTRLGESRNLKFLGKVLDNDIALKAFREGFPLQDALLLTSEPYDIYKDSLEKADIKLKMALSNIHLIGEVLASDVQRAQDLVAISRSVYAAIRDRFDSQND